MAGFVGIRKPIEEAPRNSRYKTRYQRIRNRYEQDMTALIGKTDDAKEAQRAFAEKRAPVFTGR